MLIFIKHSAYWNRLDTKETQQWLGAPEIFKAFKIYMYVLIGYSYTGHTHVTMQQNFISI